MKQNNSYIRLMVLVALFTIHCSLFTSPIKAQIGSWRNYLAYSEIQQIQAAGDDLFVMASNNLYQYNQKDQSITTYDKINGMSDTYISHIRWCKQAKRLVVVYSNSNIDLIETNGNIINISDLYTKSITGDKTVSSIRIDGVYAYLICGFGIVKLNVQRAEIADSYTTNHPDYPTSLPAEDNSDYDKYIQLVSSLKPGGPKYNYFHNMIMHENNLYTVGGGWYQLGNFERPGIIQVLNDNKDWIVFQENITPAFAEKYEDANSIAIDPLNSKHVMVASCSGIYEFMDGVFQKNYTQGNTDYFQSAASDNHPSYVRTDGIIYDKQGNLYCLNSGSKTAIIKLSNNGTWSGFMNDVLIDKPNLSMRGLIGSIIDSKGCIWFINHHNNKPAFFCYNPQTNSIKKYNTFINEDGTSLNTNIIINCICEDLNGYIWVGTNKGPVYLKEEQINDSSLGVIQHKVPRNDGTDYADYLLSGIDITCMAVDKAGRKWFGTSNNGVYLISTDNNEQEQHFTAENSKLLSNYITSIAINNKTGEVFFGTEKGLCSYISDATEPNTEMTTDNVWAYPNPVTPDYTGLITITGLSYDADVKILSTNGALMAEGRSNGGTFTWNGCDRNGNRVASGIYMVVTATSDGNKGTVCKIAVVR